MLFTWLRKYSIRWQLLSLGIAIVLLLSVAAVWGYQQILNMTYKRNSEYMTEMLSTIKQTIASNTDTINRILPNIVYNESVQEYMKEEDRLKQFLLNNKIEKVLVNLQSLKKGILGVTLRGQGPIAYNCLSCRDYIPFQEIPERTNAYYSGVSYSPYYKDYVMYVGVPVYDLLNMSTVENKLGYAVMVLSLNAVTPNIDTLSKKIAGNFYVLDRNNVIGSSNDSRKIGSKLAPELEKIVAEGGSSVMFRQNGTKFIVYAETIPEIGGRIVSVLPAEELFHGLEEVQRLMLGMFILLIAVMYVFYIAVSRNILQPIRSFISFIYVLRSGGLQSIQKRVQMEGYAEISIMARQFNTLLDEIDELTANLVDTRTHIYELQLHKKQAELQYLKSQINPHFLYNTLETIKGIAYVKGVPEIRDMTDALSRMFRYSIKGGEEVRLGEEIDIIQAYISIQQVRFGDRFEVIYDFEPGCHELRTVKMIFQPLVENALFHGIELCMHRPVLVVGCRIDKDEGVLIIRVEDDGVGIEPDKLAEIRERLQSPFSVTPDAPAPKHIGLLNVNNRIKFAYGTDYGIMSVDSEPGHGTKVTLKIPVRGDNDVQGYAG